MMTHSHSAPITVSKDLETSMSTPIRAHPPISVPTTMINVGQLTRRVHQLRHVDRLGLGGTLADVLQEPALAPQAPVEGGVERGLCRCRRGAFQHLRRDTPCRGVGGSFGAHGHGRGRHGTGQVAIKQIRPRARRGVAEVRHRGGPRHRVDQQRVTADRAVRDPRPAQYQQLPVHLVQRDVADVGRVSLR